MFDNIFYLQTRGTAMGARFAPTYANLYMGWWEETHVFEGENPLLNNVVLYRRFINDLLFIWAGDGELFNSFVKSLDNEALNLRFTSLADSCHPRHFNRGIPRGQFLRLRRNCSTEGKYIEESCKLRDRFLCKGYDMKILQDAFVSALKMERGDLITGGRKKSVRGRGLGGTAPWKHEEQQKITMSMTHSAQYNQIKNIFLKHLPVLYGDRMFKKILEPGVRVVARKAPTLGMALAPSLFQSDSKPKTWLQSLGMYRCGSKRCLTCGVIQLSKDFECSVTHETFQIRSYINCNTSGVVYLITCKKCGVQYVGCTMRSLKSRIREHLNTIRSGSDSTPVSRHFRSCNDGDLRFVSVQGIERVTLGPRGGDLQAKLLKAEAKWIFKLCTRQPRGLNSVFDISCYF
ncbi:hypothetical protein XELAEV_18006665mg [Xenopus laevis]|uniref:GIY-YIG domain-containing protein n=1 Tax=Xenopus laevis TaxID=8355 RepID=A0A974E1F8_XENLA|nr:hypothetical protein XELAEV_18006665mg [Xenopus laevis]